MGCLWAAVDGRTMIGDHHDRDHLWQAPTAGDRQGCHRPQDKGRPDASRRRVVLLGGKVGRDDPSEVPELDNQESHEAPGSIPWQPITGATRATTIASGCRSFARAPGALAGTEDSLPARRHTVACLPTARGVLPIVSQEHRAVVPNRLSDESHARGLQGPPLRS